MLCCVDNIFSRLLFLSLQHRGMSYSHHLCHRGQFPMGSPYRGFCLLWLSQHGKPLLCPERTSTDDVTSIGFNHIPQQLERLRAGV